MKREGDLAGDGCGEDLRVGIPRGRISLLATESMYGCSAPPSQAALKITRSAPGANRPP